MTTILSQFLEVTGHSSFDELSLEEKGIYACLWHDLVGGKVSKILSFNTEILNYFYKFLEYSGIDSYASLFNSQRYAVEDCFYDCFSSFEDLISTHDCSKWYDKDKVIFDVLIQDYVSSGKVKHRMFNWSYRKYSEFVAFASEKRFFDSDYVKSKPELLELFHSLVQTFES